MYTIKYNRKTNHIAGLTERTQSTGEERGGVVAYYAENACGALTRYRFADGTSHESLADALSAARAGERNLCKTCEKAALAELAELAESESEASDTESTESEASDELDTHVVSYGGGKVHTAMPDMPEGHAYPLCRGGGMNNRNTKFRTTDAPLSCATCIGYKQRRNSAASAPKEDTTKTTKAATSAVSRNLHKDDPDNPLRELSERCSLSSLEEFREDARGLMINYSGLSTRTIDTADYSELFEWFKYKHTDTGESGNMAAKKSETVAEHNARVREEVSNGIARIRSLVQEGDKEDAVAELYEEVGELITSLPVGERNALRQDLDAAKAKPSVEVEPANSAAVSKASEHYQDYEDAVKLVDMGASKVTEGVRQHIKKSTLAKEIAEIIFDIRRRLTNKDGNPDLTARSNAAKKAARDIYEKAGNMLGSDEDMDEFDVAEAAKKLRKAVQNAMLDVSAAYLRGLDDDSEEAEAERALFTSITGESPDRPVSQIVADHYGLKLKGHTELMRERYHAKKALEAGKSEEGEGDSNEGGEDSGGASGGGADETTPDERVQQVVNKLWRDFEKTNPEDFENASEETKQAVRDKVEAMKKAATEMLAAIL